MPPAVHDDLPALLVRRWPERRAVVLAAAAVCFACIFAARISDAAVADGLALLFVVPVALVALELGLAGGLAGALVAVGLMLTWLAIADPDVGALGVVTRSLVFVAVGAIAGRFADRMRRAQVRQAILLRSGLDLSRIDERTSLAEAIASALVRLPHVAAARVELHDGTAASEGDVAAGPVTTVPIEAHGVQLGAATVVVAGRPGLDDRAALAAVLVQAGVAAENRRLLQQERERAVLEAELVMARHLVDEQRRGLRAALDRQEHQRRAVAEELHEDKAQALAAVLLGLRALQGRQDLNGGPELEELRNVVHDTVVELRRIATELRPVTLDQLGLVPALVNLAASEQEARGAAVTVRAGELDHRLDEETETAVYRVVEEAIRTLDGPLAVTVQRADGDGLRVEVRSRRGDDARVDPAALEVLRVRSELLGGTVDAAPGRVAVTVRTNTRLAA